MTSETRASPERAGTSHGGKSLNAGAPPPLRQILNGIDRLGRLDGWLGALCLVLLTGLILAEVLVRALSAVIPQVPASIPIAWEYSSYLMAATFTFGAAMTLRGGGHIRVGVLLTTLPTPLRRLLEAIAALIGLAFLTFLAYAMMRFTWTSYLAGQTSISSGTPLWPPQAVVTFGICLLTLQMLARLIQVAVGLPLEDPSLRASSGLE